MKARLLARNAATQEDAAAARLEVERAKTALGETGPVWWDDGAADVSGQNPEDTPYQGWWRSLKPATRARGSD